MLLAAGPMLAFAEDYPATLSYNNLNSSTTFYATPKDACLAMQASQPATRTVTGFYGWLSASSSAGYCSYTQSGSSYNAEWVYRSNRCPYGGSITSATMNNWGGGICSGAPSCPTGQQRDTVTGECKEPPCQAGTAGEGNFDIAYRSNTNTADGSSLIGGTRIPATACDGQCQLSVGAYSGGCWLKTDSGPPYAVSCSFHTTTTGQTCTAADTSGSAPLPPIPCPSGTAVGSVNEVQGCYPVSTKSSETTKTTNPDNSTTEQTVETTCTGDQCTNKTITKTCDQAGNCSTSETQGPASDATPGDVPTAEEKEIQNKICESDPECAKGKFTKAQKGTFDLAGASSEKASAEAAFKSKWLSVKAEMSNAWGAVSAGGGSLPCFGTFTVLGRTTSLCIKPEWLSWLPSVVMLVAAILAAFILFRR